MIQPHCCTVGGKWSSRRGEGGSITHSRRKTHFIDSTTEGGVSDASVMLFGAKHQIRIGRVAGAATIAIAGVARRTLHRSSRLAVDEQLHKPIQPAHRRHMMPLTIDNRLRATQSRAGCADREAKGDDAPTHCNAKVAVVARPKDVTVDHCVRRDPAIIGAAGGRAVVLSWRRLQPEFNREVGGADISRTRRRVDRNQHTILTWRSDAVAVQFQGVIVRLCVCQIERRMHTVRLLPEYSKQRRQRAKQPQRQLAATPAMHALDANLARRPGC